MPQLYSVKISHVIRLRCCLRPQLVHEKKKSSSAIAIQEHCWHAISLMPFFILFIIFFSLNRDVDWGGSVYLAKDGSSFIVNNRIIRPFRRRWVERLDSI